MSKDTMEVRLKGTGFLVVNLSHPMMLSTEVYPGDPKITRRVFSEIDETGYHHLVHEVGDHNFHPHADAPSHQNPELKDKGIEYWGMEHFFNNAMMIDLAPEDSLPVKELDCMKTSDGMSYRLKVKRENLTAYEDRLSKVGAVIIRTGYDKWLEANKPHNPNGIPYLTKDAAEYLVTFPNLRVIGTDSLTIDPVGVHDAHRILTKDKFIVECLVNLHKIPLESRSNFELITSPIVIKGSTGAPVVAYALC